MIDDVTTNRAMTAVVAVFVVMLGDAWIVFGLDSGWLVSWFWELWIETELYE